MERIVTERDLIHTTRKRQESGLGQERLSQRKVLDVVDLNSFPFWWFLTPVNCSSYHNYLNYVPAN